jgi:dolichyl-phosphate beta-glucosyltransferase
VIRFDKEASFLNPLTGKTENFPSIDDAPTMDLSVIVPAYDEEERRKFEPY